MQQTTNRGRDRMEESVQTSDAHSTDHRVLGATALSGAIAGVVTGMAGGPPGMIAGGVLGMAAGLLAGAALGREAKRQARADSVYDAIAVKPSPRFVPTHATRGLPAFTVVERSSWERKSPEDRALAAFFGPDCGALCVK